MVGRRLRELGIEAGIESEPAHGTFWWPLGSRRRPDWSPALAALRGHRMLGAALAAAAGAAALDDLPPLGGRRAALRASEGPADDRWSPSLVPRTPSVRSCWSPTTTRAHCGLIFNPEIPEAVERPLPGSDLGGPDTSPPVIGGPVAADPGGDRAGIGHRQTEADAGRNDRGDRWARRPRRHREARTSRQARTTTATGVVALLAIARALVERPPESLRVLLLSTSEEATCDGMQAWFRRSAPSLPRESTFFICLDILGSPHLVVLRGEGMVRIREYPGRSLALLDELAEELGIPLFPNLRLMNATDGVIPLAHGYQCASLCSCTDLKQAANYHWPSDTPDNVDYGTLADAIRLAEAVVRRLDERWL